MVEKSDTTEKPVSQGKGPLSWARMLGAKATGRAVNGKEAGSEASEATVAKVGDASGGGATATSAPVAKAAVPAVSAAVPSSVPSATTTIASSGTGAAPPAASSQPLPPAVRPVPVTRPPPPSHAPPSHGHHKGNVHTGKPGGHHGGKPSHGHHQRPHPGGNVGMQVPVQYQPTQQFPVNMPQYVQPQYMQGSGYPQPYYAFQGNFRPPAVANYYMAGGVVGGVGGVSLPEHTHVGSPGSMGGPTGVTPPAKPAPPKVTPPPVREKRILRIEDPNTHVALDLKEISKTTEKKKEGGEEKSVSETSASGAASETTASEASAAVVAPPAPAPPAAPPAPPAPPAAPAPPAPPAVVPPAPPAAPAPPAPAAPFEQAMSEEQPKEFVKKEAFRADGTRKMTYSADELLSHRAANTALPPHIETATLSALFNLKREDSSRGKDNWNSGSKGPPPPPRRQNSRQNSRGLDDSWGGRRAPPGALRHQASRDLPALHRSATAYKVGQTASADPEEELSQKALKGLLNKITPDNFMKITDQIVAKINERKKAKTLMGFINQIFDKALAESTFAELYADLVSKLIPALPDLTDDDDNVVNFRRALLNKCQEEFDYGVCAMKAVAEREKHKDEEQTDQDKADMVLEQTARKRMLGNIIFVGQLYRFGVLIEAVMHTCVRQLLEETVDPRPEDIEVLCRLMSTVGRPMDASTREIKGKDGQVIKTSDMMEVYFRRIEMLSSSDKLDMRHRFMLKDLLDLRRSGWRERRKSEGPKKISDIHKDASKDARMKRTDSTMSRGKSGPGGGGRGGRDGRDGRDDGMRRDKSRTFDRVDAPPRTFSKNRAQEQTSLRPQSSMRHSPSSGAAMNDSSNGTARQERSERSETETSTEVSESTAVESEATSANAASLSQDELARKVKTILEELYLNKDEAEAVKEMNDLAAAGDAVIKQAVVTSMDMKSFDGELLGQALAAFDKADAAAFDSATNKILAELADLVVDVPMATKYCGRIFADLIAAGKLDLSSVLSHAATADLEPPPDGEDTMLVDGGDALKLAREILGRVTASKEDGETVSVSKEAIAALMPKTDRSDDAAEAILKEFNR